MTTRAAQIELLIDSLIDPTTGGLCSGYTVEFYAAGTSTPKNVWTELEKTSPFTTYTLDSGGKALLYGDGVYKIVIKNTDGSTVLSLDNQKIQATTFSVAQKVGAYTATPDDDVVLCNGTFTVSLAPVATFDNPVIIKSIGTGTITVDPYGSETIDGSATVDIVNQYDAITLFPDATSNVWRKSGSLTADLNGTELILDADADTSITADTDDQIDFKLNGTDTFQMTTTAFKADAISEKTSAAGVTIDGIRLKDDGIKPNGTQLNIDIGGTNQIYITDGFLNPVTDADVSLGQLSPDKRWNYIVGMYFYGVNLYLWNGSSHVKQGIDITAALHRKIVEIGDWDMDTNHTTTVAHGLTFTKIRSVTGIVRNDADTAYYPVSGGASVAGTTPFISSISSTTVTINIFPTGFFDDPAFNATSFNRGWIVIDYVD